MKKSRILGQNQKIQTNIKYTDSHFEQQQTQTDNQILKNLAQGAAKSFIGAKSKQKAQNINVQDIIQTKRQKIFPSNSHIPDIDLRVSQLPNFNVLIIQNIIPNKQKNCFCSMTSDIEEVFVQIQEPCRLLFIKKETKTIVYSINFDTIKAQVRSQFQKNALNQFILIADKLTLKISHVNLAVIKQWYKRLQQMIKNSWGKQFNINEISQTTSQLFYTRRFCTEDQFVTNCQTGDILLFEDDHFFAKAQRFILNADYDHVAMIIRDKNYGILMFQANSYRGVSLTPWNCMIKYKWYKLIKRIVWRKLQNVQRSQYFQKAIHQFVKTNLKTKYYISIEKILTNRSKIVHKQSQQKQQKKGYFCSQLIAKVYKGLEILTQNVQDQDYKASNQTYPYHFSQKYNLKLKMGNLSHQYDIHFNQNVLKNQYGEKFFNR